MPPEPSPESSEHCDDPGVFCINIPPGATSQTFEVEMSATVTSSPWLFRAPDNLLEILVQVLPTFMVAVAAIAVFTRERSSIRPIAWFWITTIAATFLAFEEAILLYQLLLVERDRMQIWQVFSLAVVPIIGSIALLRIALHPGAPAANATDTSGAPSSETSRPTTAAPGEPSPIAVRHLGRSRLRVARARVRVATRRTR
ncbi:hypothetical protein [Agromyces seonyuensis]|uniref:Uncharacterized protein n=1 Tax=Agromyces seonyuensis TaxID=2662446 RepID=A0A6I4NYP3_9MICO|nr:hypothetical protein [Agromyces seonyuensis]MWB99426.1 hypothetical protein [Agromyces seonyuensis]